MTNRNPDEPVSQLSRRHSNRLRRTRNAFQRRERRDKMNKPHRGGVREIRFGRSMVVEVPDEGGDE